MTDGLQKGENMALQAVKSGYEGTGHIYPPQARTQTNYDGISFGAELAKEKEIQEDQIAEERAMKASLEGTEYYVCSDALFSICHVPTGETANVYKAYNYSEDNPVYVVKGKDKNGNDYEQEINVNEVDTDNCSYVEILAWSVHTKYVTPENYIKICRMIHNAGEVSFMDKIDYKEIVKKLMEEMKSVGELTDYLEYKRLLEELEK